MSRRNDAQAAAGAQAVEARSPVLAWSSSTSGDATFASWYDQEHILQVMDAPGAVGTLMGGHLFAADTGGGRGSGRALGRAGAGGPDSRRPGWPPS